MKKKIAYMLLVLLSAGILGCAYMDTRESQTEIHPGHVGHEVH